MLIIILKSLSYTIHNSDAKLETCGIPDVTSKGSDKA